MKTLRDYQLECAKKAHYILIENKIVYLSMEVRTGKTPTSMEVARLYGAKNVLFLTKKKAITSIENDYIDFLYNNHFSIDIINDESLHKVDAFKYDLVIHDEHHRFGSVTKPSKSTKLFKEMFSHLPMIFLSGTPTPESHSQIFHQLWVSDHSPFSETNFYKWAKKYVRVKQKHLGYAIVNDYSDAIVELIDPVVSSLFVTYTQKDAGFSTSIKEHILHVPMSDSIQRIIKRLTKDRVIEGKDETILADTGVKLMLKIHQLCSGTVKFESGNAKVLDYSKAKFIRDYFNGNKIGIFYKFKAELDALKTVFGDSITTELDEFNTTDKNIALQIVSGREGTSLKMADKLVFYNIDFSAVSYFQAIDRLTTMERLTNDVYWIFSEGGIENNIYKAVQEKKDYTLRYFKKDYGIKI